MTTAADFDEYTDIRNTDNTQREKATCTPSKVKGIVRFKHYPDKDATVYCPNDNDYNSKNPFRDKAMPEWTKCGVCSLQ